MLQDRIRPVEDIAFTKTPWCYFDYLRENYGRPCSINQIARSVIYNGRDVELSASDRNAVKWYVGACRKALGPSFAIYNLKYTSSYVLTKKQENDSLISLPFKHRPGMSILPKEALKAIHTYKVLDNQTLGCFFTAFEYDIFWQICESSWKDEYISRKKLACDNYGFQDQSELDLVMAYIYRIRKKLKEADIGVSIETKHEAGYKVIVSSQNSKPQN